MNNIVKNIVFLTLALFIFYTSGTLIRSKLISFVSTLQLTSSSYIQNLIALNPEGTTAVFNNDLVYADISDLFPLFAQAEKITDVLGDTTDRWIEINLSQQRLYAWEGNNLFGSYLVSTGKWAPTPTGNYNVWIKLAKTRMRGGSVALGTYYNLPNVPCTMYFYKGYGIHGAYWHNNFGQPMSHGCVNMRPNEACQVFNWASVGTRVNIHY